ncbi:O-acyltransferase [Nakaseomyces bracarensis]|uniref:O-acyltransferase n=1 Tax=Nakaseomyces bracarensis TaxID=273131 RepID=UPI003871D6CC
MSFLKCLLPLVDVEHLDSRLVPRPATEDSGSNTSTSSTNNGNKESIKEKKTGKKGAVVAGKSLWGTLEFKLYYVIFILVVPQMFMAGYRASSSKNENYYRYQHLLSDGWLFGRKVDNSDAQYRFFRDHFWLLVAIVPVHVIIKRYVLGFTGASKFKFDALLGCFVLFGAHGVNSLRIAAHMFILYSIAHLLKKWKKLAVILTWVYGISTLFINDNYRAYPFGQIWSILSPLDTMSRGIIERWDVFFNFSLLRMISYNLDYLTRYELSTKGDDSSKKNDDINNAELLYNDKARMNAVLPMEDYGVVNYLAYMIYTPLFIAGPIITFNDYIFQSKRTLPSIKKDFIIWYAIRFVFTVLFMELILHFFYVVAISKTKAWDNDSPFEISMIGLINLNIIWFKLMIPWRLFRLWALLDGIDTPENMIRCVDNNYSALAFWRAWHRSYNKWVVRYIYVPLGGSKNRIITSLAVFSFVAVWHDIQLKLLLWGWMVVLFLLPEMFATNYFSQFREKPWYRHICALGGAVNIWLMMIANLFGFCLGSDGTKKLLADMFATWSGFLFVILSFMSLFVGVQLMFEIREEEKRNGIDLKC